MPITIKSVKGYYYLDAWVMANIIQIGTKNFVRRFLNKDNDPCGRMYDQMTMAARSTTANIAEGASRRQTSRETEMKLTDVARASLSELLGDFFHFSLMLNIEPWQKLTPQYQSLNAIQLDRPDYGEDIQHDAWLHVKKQYERSYVSSLRQAYAQGDGKERAQLRQGILELHRLSRLSWDQKHLLRKFDCSNARVIEHSSNRTFNTYSNEF